MVPAIMPITTIHRTHRNLGNKQNGGNQIHKRDLEPPFTIQSIRATQFVSAKHVNTTKCVLNHSFLGSSRIIIILKINASNTPANTEQSSINSLFFIPSKDFQSNWWHKGVTSILFKPELILLWVQFYFIFRLAINPDRKCRLLEHIVTPIALLKSAPNFCIRPRKPDVWGRGWEWPVFAPASTWQGMRRIWISPDIHSDSSYARPRRWRGFRVWICQPAQGWPYQRPNPGTKTREPFTLKG